MEPNTKTKSLVRFTLNRQVLSDALDFVGVALAKSNKDFLLSHIVFDATDGNLRILSSNRNLWACSYLPATSGDVRFKFGVSGSQLINIVKQVEDEDLEFAIDLNSSVQINGNRMSLYLNVVFDMAAFPFPDKDFQTALKVSEYTTREAIRALNFAKVYIDPLGNQPGLTIAQQRDGRFVAGSVSRVGIYESPTFVGDLKLTLDPCSGLLGFVKALNSETVDLYSSKSRFYFVDPESKSFLGFIKTDLVYPMVEEKLLITSVDYSFGLSKSSLEGALKRLKLVLPDEEVKMSFEVIHREGTDLLKISCANSSGHVSEEWVPVSLDGTAEEPFAINYTRLLEVLSIFESDTLTVEVTRRFISVIEETSNFKQRSIITYMNESSGESNWNKKLWWRWAAGGT